MSCCLRAAGSTLPTERETRTIYFTTSLGWDLPSRGSCNRASRGLAAALPSSLFSFSGLPLHLLLLPPLQRLLPGTLSHPRPSPQQRTSPVFRIRVNVKGCFDSSHVLNLLFPLCQQQLKKATGARIAVLSFDPVAWGV